MDIKTINVSGLSGVLEALRLPFGKEVRSAIGTDSKRDKGVLDDEIVPTFYSAEAVRIHPKDLTLLQTLVKRGDEHAKCIRGLMVWAKITAPVYWWAELETYRAGHERLASESTMHIDCKGLQGEDLQKAKAEIPMGKELTKVDMFSYQALRNIYKQRHGHRLPEWHSFCDWVKTLPLAEELILTGLNEA